MVKTFRDTETELLWTAEVNRQIPANIHKTAFRKLQMLNAAVVLTDLLVPPGNRLEALKGDRTRQRSKSRTTTEGRNMAQKKQKTLAAHPGEILRTEFMEPMGISAYRLAKELHLPGVYEIVREERAISADVALRLGKYFGTTPQFWMNLQTDYDLRQAASSAPLSKIKPHSAKNPAVQRDKATVQIR